MAVPPEDELPEGKAPEGLPPLPEPAVPGAPAVPDLGAMFQAAAPGAEQQIAALSAGAGDGLAAKNLAILQGAGPAEAPALIALASSGAARSVCGQVGVVVGGFFGGFGTASHALSASALDTLIATGSLPDLPEGPDVQGPPGVPVG